MKSNATPPASGALKAWALLGALALSTTAADLRAQAVTNSAPKVPEDQKETVLQMEAMSVTGSNIKRMDIEQVLPVTIMNHDAIDARGALTPADLLLSLPQVTNVPLNETTQGSAGARGDVAAVNLRGLGSSNSLILLNGRRLVAHPTSGALSYAANVNQLPTQGIAQIEVLRDSASSVYGSDAVAGVVNYIMRKDYRGTEVKTRFTAPEHGKGRSAETTLTTGDELRGGRFRYMTVLDFLYREAIYLRDRSFTRQANHSAQAPAPFNVNGSAFDGSALVGNYPTFLIGTATATNYFRPINGVMTFTAVTPTRAANPDYFVNLNDYYIGSPRTDRINWFGSAEYDLNNRVTAFTDLSFYHAETTTQRQPISITAPTTDTLAPVSIDNPYNPYGSRFYDLNGAPNPDGTPRLTGAPRAITLASEFIKDLPSDKTIVDSNTYRIVAGLKGKIGQTWTWESGAMFSRSAVTDHSPFYVRESLLQKALMRTDSTAFNPFGYTFKVSGGAVVPDQVFNNPHSVMDGFVTRFRRDGLSEIASIDARASGQLFSLWSGAVSLAVGAEYRREQFSDLRPLYISINPPNVGLDPNDNDVLQFPPAPDSSGHRTVGSVYAETVIPLVAPKNNLPLVRSLEVTGSARFERYSDFGNTTKPKIGVNWKPFTAVMLRASYSQGFTAPSLPLLYAPAQYNTSGGSGTIDPYRNPVTNEGGYATRTISSGNRALKAADSTGKSAGIVIDVPKIQGLSLSADYWEISRNGVFGSRSATEILNTDANLLRAATAAQLAAGKTISQVDLGSGTAAYKGDPAVIRYAVAPEDTTAFVKSTTAGVVGKILSVSTIYLNLAEDFASGWDLSLNYSSRAFKVGRFGFNSDWAYLRKSYSVSSPPNATPTRTDRVNVAGASRWHGNTTVSWHLAKWSAGVSAYYTGAYAATGATTTQAVWDSLGDPAYIIKQFTAGSYSYYYKIHDSITYNSFASYRFGAEGTKWLRQTSIRVGVINVFDAKPPLSTGQNGYDTSVYNGLLAGRTWTLDLTKAF